MSTPLDADQAIINQNTDEHSYNQDSKKMGVLLYRPSGVPRYFEFGPSWPWWVLVLPSAMALISLGLVLGGFLYVGHMQKQQLAHEPQLLAELKQKSSEMLKENEELKQLSTQLQEELASSASKSTPEHLWPMTLFRASAQEVKAESIPSFSIEDAEAFNSDKGINFRFNIVNLSKDGQKLSGHIFVLMKQSNSIHVFPANAFAEDDAQLPFNKGESFATTKFRPVEANFPVPSHSGKLLFKVLIFSRTGNLIRTQIFFQDVKI